MNLIITVDEKWGADKDGDLLAHPPEDMKCFGEMTRGRAVVMGRRILESFPEGKPLKNRASMVLSRDEAYAPEDIQVYHSVEDVLETLRDCREEDVFITGRGVIYRKFLPYCSKAYVTYIHRAFNVDTAFKNLDQDGNRKLESVSDGKEYGGISFELRVYKGVR